MTDTPGAQIDLGAALAARFPELDELRSAAGGAPLYLVGGAVRDLLADRDTDNLDLVVEGDAAALAHRVGAEVVEHDRFATAKARIGAREVDLATARTETYPRPGALPEVRPATITEDLRRRDFTVNAMAIPLQGETELIDPHGGSEDLDRGLLRVLHDRSFVDDPTRALRAARYAARLGLEVEPHTAELLRATDLGTVSEDRRHAELRKLGTEAGAVRGFELLSEWGLLQLGEDELQLLGALDRLLADPPWSEVASRERALRAAARGELGRGPDLAAAHPSLPSEAVELARGAAPEELAIGRALGGAWLDAYVTTWRSIVLEIAGGDLIAAGIPEGPAVGRGLEAALRRKLDGQISGRDEELAVALAAARRGS
jgi:tRNA nucleotidyltransferase (CCA-adding enzyme)